MKLVVATRKKKRDSFSQDLSWASDISANDSSNSAASERSYVKPIIKKICDDDEEWFSEAESDFSDFEPCTDAAKVKTKLRMQSRARNRAEKVPKSPSSPAGSTFSDDADFSSEFESEAESVTGRRTRKLTRKNRKASQRSSNNNMATPSDEFSPELEYEAKIIKDATKIRSSEKDERRRERKEPRAKTKTEAAWGSELESEAEKPTRSTRKKQKETAAASDELNSEIEGTVDSKKSKLRRKVRVDDRGDFPCDSEADSSISRKEKSRKKKPKDQPLPDQSETPGDPRGLGSRAWKPAAGLLRSEDSIKQKRTPNGDEQKSQRTNPGSSAPSDNEGRKSSHKSSIAERIGVIENCSRKFRHSSSDLVRSASKHVLSRHGSERSMISSNTETAKERSRRGQRTAGTDSTGDERFRMRSGSNSSKRSNLLGNDGNEATEDECESELDLSSHKATAKKSTHFEMVRADSIRRKKPSASSIPTKAKANDIKEGRKSPMEHAAELEKDASIPRRHATTSQSTDMVKVGSRRRLAVQRSARDLIADPERARMDERFETKKQWLEKDNCKASCSSSFGDTFDQKAGAARDKSQINLDQSRKGPDMALNSQKSIRARRLDKLLCEDDKKSFEQQRGNSSQRGTAFASDCSAENLHPTSGHFDNRGNSYLPSALSTNRRDPAVGGVDGFESIHSRIASLNDLLGTVEGGANPLLSSSSVPDRFSKKKLSVKDGSASLPGDTRAASTVRLLSTPSMRGIESDGRAADNRSKPRRLVSYVKSSP